MKILNKFLIALIVIISSYVSQINAQVNPDYPSMDGKTVLITGSTDGLGREVAIRLGMLGAHVLVHGRNAQRGAEVVEKINNSAGSAKFYQADFGSLKNVRELANTVKRDHQKLDILINNAGLGSGFAGGQRRVSQDGYEMVLQVNFLAHYLLTDLLLPLLKDGAPSRIINVASRAQSPINFGDIMLENYFSGRATYHRSKLAQVMHAFHYSELLQGSQVTFNTLHPASMMDTTMVAQMAGPARTTVDEGARALMMLAVSPDLEGRSGLYFVGHNEGRANDQAYDVVARAELDKIARELIKLPPREN
jgi:NAD(P)-dependent dehydrogenase (short-subunit alcohol dehydrogenase family)